MSLKTAPTINPIDAQYEPRPKDIPFLSEESEQLGFFGKCETEIVAGRLVRFFQSQGSWAPFDIKELVEFYEQNGWETTEMFYGLTGVFLDGYNGWLKAPDYLAFSSSGCGVTEEFVTRCLTKPR